MAHKRTCDHQICKKSLYVVLVHNIQEERNSITCQKKGYIIEFNSVGNKQFFFGTPEVDIIGIFLLKYKNELELVTSDINLMQ